MTKRKHPRPIAQCMLCGRRAGLKGTDYCAQCIEATRERLRCPDCDWTVVVVVAEGVQGMYADITCSPHSSIWTTDTPTEPLRPRPLCSCADTNAPPCVNADTRIDDRTKQVVKWTIKKGRR